MFGWLLKREYKGMIKIDLDIPEPSLMLEYLHGVRELLKHFGIIKIQINPSRTNYHLRGKLTRKITEPEALLIQVLCGSDIKREIMNYKRVLSGAKLEDWNILFIEKFD